MAIRFIVVDDAAFLRELVKNILTDAGHIFVGEAANGVEALQVAQSSLPDLVFMDMVMPQKNGIEATKEIKSFLPEVKVIGCSTIDQEGLIAQAKSAGFDAYIQKPFTKEQILTAVLNMFPQLGETHNGRV